MIKVGRSIQRFVQDLLSSQKFLFFSGLYCLSEGSRSKIRKETSSEQMNKPDVPRAESSNIQKITIQQLASSNSNDQFNCPNPTARHFSTDETHASFEAERRSTMENLLTIINHLWSSTKLWLSGAFLTVKNFASCHPKFNLLTMCFTLLSYARGEEVVVIAAHLIAYYFISLLAYFLYSNHKSILHLTLNFVNLLNTIFQIPLWILKLLYKVFELLQLLLCSLNNCPSPATINIRHLQRNNRDKSELVIFFCIIIIMIMIKANIDDTTTANTVK